MLRPPSLPADGSIFVLFWQGVDQAHNLEVFGPNETTCTLEEAELPEEIFTPLYMPIL